MRFVEHKINHSTNTKSDKVGNDHGDIDPIIVKKLSVHEKLAEEMKQSEIDCEPLPLGLQPIERKQYYSHTFSMSPKFVTNKGLVKIRGKNIDFVQLLQRN
jgi:hypothetical protein